MIFTRKGLLGNKRIEEIYVLSMLIDQTFHPDELKKVNKDLRIEKSNYDEDNEILIKAKKISELNNLKESLKTKYENIRKKCIIRQNVLKRSLVWILFSYSLRLADYIFQGYTYPPAIRALLSSDPYTPGMINYIFPIRDTKYKGKYWIDSLYGEKNWFESKKLCDAIFSEKAIDFNFLSTIKNISGQIPEIKSYSERISSQFRPSEYIKTPIDLNKRLIKNAGATFLIRAQVDSMKQHNIHFGDIAIVDRSIRAAKNDIVVASKKGELILGCLTCGPNGFQIKKKKGISAQIPGGEMIEHEETILIDNEANGIIGVVTSTITEH